MIGSGILTERPARSGREWWSLLESAFLRACAPLRRRICRPVRSLKLTETLSLGEKRFVAIVECADQRFLIGGAVNSVAMLAVLPLKRDDFARSLRECQGEGEK